MAEYYVNPNTAAAPAANTLPSLYAAAPNANVLPAKTAPVYTKPAYPYVMPYGRPSSAEAILVLFILLVIITRMCR